MLEKVELFKNKKEFFLFFVFILFILFLNISYEFYKYKKLTSYKTATINAYVLNQYIKKSKYKKYKVIKLKTNDGHIFYTTASIRFRNVKNKFVTIKIYTSKITFLNYLKGFYANGRFLKIKNDTSQKHKILSIISQLHADKNISQIYQALFFAKPLSYELYNRFSALGISHLFAISGFHLGILSAFLFFIFNALYLIPHKYFFPYRNKNRNIFIISLFCIFLYLDFLEYPPSLIRAFGMMSVGFFLYDRGIKVISIQTLFISVLIIIAFIPTIIFSLGFWLSVLGVYYILLFILHFKDLKIWQYYFLIPIWVYLMMLPTSLYIFHNFSIYHPFSIIIGLIFSLFYPLSIFLHLIGYGDIFDFLIAKLIYFPISSYKINLHYMVEISFLALSFLTLKYKKLIFLLFIYSLFIFGYAMISYFF